MTAGGLARARSGTPQFIGTADNPRKTKTQRWTLKEQNRSEPIRAARSNLEMKKKTRAHLLLDNKTRIMNGVFRSASIFAPSKTTGVEKRKTHPELVRVFVFSCSVLFCQYPFPGISQKNLLLFK